MWLRDHLCVSFPWWSREQRIALLSRGGVFNFLQRLVEWYSSLTVLSPSLLSSQQEKLQTGNLLDSMACFPCHLCSFAKNSCIGRNLIVLGSWKSLLCDGGNDWWCFNDQLLIAPKVSQWKRDNFVFAATCLMLGLLPYWWMIIQNLRYDTFLL